MIDASQLSRAVLEDALGQIADRLFLDINPVGCPAELRDQDVYNPDKDWDLDDLEFIAGLLRTAGLAPDRLGDQPPRDDPPAASGPHPRCRPAPAGRAAGLPRRVRVTFDLSLELQLTRRQARHAGSDEFRARLRSALAHSTAREALSEALDADVLRLALRPD